VSAGAGIGPRPRTVVHYTDTAGFGGAEQGLLTLLEGLDRTRWDPVLLHHAYPGVAPMIEKAHKLGVRTRQVDSLPRSRDWRWLRRFGAMLRDENATLFHAHLVWPVACSYGLIAAALFRVRGILATQQLFGPVETTKDRRLQKLVSLGVHRYIAVSESLARELRPLVFRPERVVVVRNSVALSGFRGAAPESLRRSLTRNGEPLVLTLARLDPQKGLPYLLEAAKVLPKATFAIAGDGRDRQALEEQARSLGLQERVRFLGYRDDIADLLAACDLFVLPSLFEGLPISVLEAMAAGKPVVATRIGGTDEAVENGVTGWLVPPRDPAALAAAVSRVLSDPSEGRRMGEAGRARALEEFSAPAMVKKTMRIYEELAS
jgi:glycosyltransferase involved in cell wall biosynthesis